MRLTTSSASNGEGVVHANSAEDALYKALSCNRFCVFIVRLVPDGNGGLTLKYWRQFNDFPWEDLWQAHAHMKEWLDSEATNQAMGDAFNRAVESPLTNLPRVL